MHHEFYHLAKKIIEYQTRDTFALATVVHVRGSAYRREGTRMVIDINGNWFGNISGGCLEGDILRKAQNAIKTGENILVTYDTRESKNKEIRVALGCNGIIDILIEPVVDETIHFVESVVDLFENEQTSFLSTEIQLIKNLVLVNRQLSTKKPADLSDKAFENENFCQIEKSEFKITLHEYIGLQRKLVIWGAGPDVQPLANFSSQLGWNTIVASDCGIENLEERLSDVDIIQCNFDDFVEKVKTHENTAVLLVSHDFYKDYFILEKIIQQDVKYIGIMGPKRRGERMVKEFKKRNPEITFDENKLHYPVGLDIGSDNPTEIALSIVAEVQSHYSGKNAAPLSQKTTRIHNTASEDTIEEFNPNDSVCTVNYFE
jgi:xanthine/CO dehydrogenase XdhC/CoxF family maturation factor